MANGWFSASSLARGVMTYLGSKQACYPYGTPSAPHPGTCGASGVTWAQE